MKYRNRLKLFGPTWIENALGEKEKDYGFIKVIYCDITPRFGGQETIGGTDVKGAYGIQRIFIRKLSVENPTIDMYFMDNKNNKYEVLDFFPNFKNNSEWEFRTRISREV